MDAIAEYPLHLKYPDGRSVPVRIRLGRPERKPSGIWECFAEFDGGQWTHSQHGPFIAPTLSNNSWQALANAFRFILMMIKREVHSGAVLYSEDGIYPIHFDELFPFPREGEQPPPS